MKYLTQATIIFGFTLIGELLHAFLPLPIPAAIYGLLLLLACLMLGIVKKEQVQETSQFLIAIMSVMFVSPAVNLLAYWGLISGSLVPIVVITVLSTVFVFGAAGLVTQIILKRRVD